MPDNAETFFEWGVGNEPASITTAPLLSQPARQDCVDDDVISSAIWPVDATIEYREVKARKKVEASGIDFWVTRPTAIRATLAGRVLYADHKLASYGNLVILLHCNGYASVYSHLSSMVVKKGQELDRGSLIGTAHVLKGGGSDTFHFEIRKNNKIIDALAVLQRSAPSLE